MATDQRIWPAVVRSIGKDYSPAFGYRGTTSLDLTKALPNSKSSPLPVPAGFLDVSLRYTASNTNAQCANASNTLTSAFLIQVLSNALYTPTCSALPMEPEQAPLHKVLHKGP